MRLVIAEDSVVLRHGLIELLTSHGHEVAAAVRDGDALRAAVTEFQPDVVIVDIRMPPTHTDEGLRAAVVLRQTHPGLGILVFSQYIETRHAAALLAACAQGVGYLLKDRVADVRDFLDSLTRIANGETVLDPEVVTQLMGTTRHTNALASLTARERQVLALMAEARTAANGGYLATDGCAARRRSYMASHATPSSPAAGWWPCSWNGRGRVRRLGFGWVAMAVRASPALTSRVLIR